MATEQCMSQAITQAAIEAAKKTITAVRKAHNPVNNVRHLHTMLRSGVPACPIGNTQASARSCATLK